MTWCNVASNVVATVSGAGLPDCGDTEGLPADSFGYICRLLADCSVQRVDRPVRCQGGPYAGG
jgi:hypothetical protein